MGKKFGRRSAKQSATPTRIDTPCYSQANQSVPILSQNTLFFPIVLYPSPQASTMTTRPSRKTPSLLLSATQASSACTRTRSSSRLARVNASLPGGDTANSMDSPSDGGDKLATKEANGVGNANVDTDGIGTLKNVGTALEDELPGVAKDTDTVGYVFQDVQDGVTAGTDSGRGAATGTTSNNADGSLPNPERLYATSVGLAADASPLSGNVTPVFVPEEAVAASSGTTNTSNSDYLTDLNQKTVMGEELHHKNPSKPSEFFDSSNVGEPVAVVGELDDKATTSFDANSYAKAGAALPAETTPTPGDSNTTDPSPPQKKFVQHLCFQNTLQVSYLDFSWRASYRVYQGS